MCAHQAHGSYIPPICVILTLFWPISCFWLRSWLLLKYNYLSICQGDLIFIFWGLLHICYEIIKSESWFNYHDIWVVFLYNIHKNWIFFQNFQKSFGRNFLHHIWLYRTEGLLIFPGRLLKDILRFFYDFQY